jgi:hypothetical protein
VEERFEDAEIGVAQSCLPDARRRVRDQRLKSFHEDEPEMNARGVFPWFGWFSFHDKFFLDQHCIDVNILRIKQKKLS